MKQKGNIIVILVILAALTLVIISIIYLLTNLNKYTSSSPNINNQSSKPIPKTSFSNDKQQSIPTKIEDKKYKVEVPAGSTDQTLNIHIQASPNVNISKEIRSIFYTLMIKAYDQNGNKVNELNKPFSIIADFTGWDSTPYKKNTFAIYYNANTSGPVNWIKLDTKIDYQKNTATAQLSKFGHFGLMAERIDTIPPETTASLEGQQIKPDLFNSDVTVTLKPQDNTGGMGIYYTAYKIDDEEWEEYKNPFTVSKVGSHKIEFLSADNDENMEERKSVSFTINNNIN